MQFDKVHIILLLNYISTIIAAEIEHRNLL